MTRLLGWLRRVLGGGERRHTLRRNAEGVQVVNRQYAAAVKLGRSIGRTPEELLDYRRADRILGSHR